ncbi:cupin domain-containing protein [Christensenellaceae bacterium NSJ-63]|uniref:Cupin domain-containing protein n=1 Tax=Guopingia tenuis TaxID=2763656 RepID=A0A926DJ52_9FIRM|nr:cupin domain-containing protein [Guopingia tenuis]MBC8538717.1 cupin domain-containing protein [Guopingia tenuis]
MLKNIKKSEILSLKDEIAYQEGQVVSKTLAQNPAVSVTLFAFEKGEEISTHESGGDAMVTVLDGTGRITIDGREFVLQQGESIVMPAKTPHAVFGEERFKMLLTVVF